MTKSAIFKAAHKIAKETVAKVGDYQIAFKLALQSIYDSAKAEVVSKVKQAKRWLMMANKAWNVSEKTYDFYYAKFEDLVEWFEDNYTEQLQKLLREYEVTY